MKIILDYKNGPYARLRKLKVYGSDHIRLTKLKQGEQKEVEVPESTVFLYGKMDWGKTERIGIQKTSDGRRIEIRPYFSLNPLRWFGIARIPIRFSYLDDGGS